jgi:hypothetical protein
MSRVKSGMRRGFLWLEDWLDRTFGPAWNPLYHLGALGFFYYWIVAVSGIYVYIFFDTGTTEAYDSIEYMTVEQWYLGGVMRSLHRYASDGMVLMMVIHILREFALDRYRGPRWFTWFTGVPVFWLVIASGITGYWLVWDKLAQYLALATTEWFDWLPIFGEPIARNFLAPSLLDDRFFTLLTFMHIAVPLILLLVLWIHLQRVSRSRIHPARGLALGTFAMLLALSLFKPAVSQGPADLARVPCPGCRRSDLRGRRRSTSTTATAARAAPRTARSTPSPCSPAATACRSSERPRSTPRTASPAASARALARPRHRSGARAIWFRESTCPTARSDSFATSWSRRPRGCRARPVSSCSAATMALRRATSHCRAWPRSACPVSAPCRPPSSTTC